MTKCCKLSIGFNSAFYFPEKMDWLKNLTDCDQKSRSVNFQLNFINHPKVKWFHSFELCFVPLTKSYNDVLWWKMDDCEHFSKVFPSPSPPALKMKMAWKNFLLVLGQFGDQRLDWIEQSYTMSDTIAILQIHSKIQYLQLSHAAAGSGPPDFWAAHKIR